MHASRIVHYFLAYTSCAVLALILNGCHEHDISKKEDVRTVLLSEINALRNNGCTCGNEWMEPVEALTHNLILEKAASDHAADMYANNYFSHSSLDGRSAIQRAQSAGYPGNYVGEVIARNYSTAKDVVQAWRESESHCRALMDSLYHEMGGASTGGYWVVDLGNSK
jgi:uncharacterized protein YkwD